MRSEGESKRGQPRNSDFLIRRAGSNDLEAMVRLLGELFAIETRFRVAPEKQRRGLKMLLGSAAAGVWVVERHGRVVGMVTLQLLVSTAEGGLSGLLEDLIVTSVHRRKGLGRELQETAVRWARSQGATRVQLLADGRNVPGVIFYRKQNWFQTNMIALCRSI